MTLPLRISPVRGVGDGFAVAPAAVVAVDPLDHVEADVEGVSVGGEWLDDEGVGCPAGGLEGGVPPARAFHEGGADRLWRAAVDEVADGLDGDACVGAAGVALDEAVADDELLDGGFAEGCVHLAVPGGEVTGARGEGAWGEAGGRQLEEGLVLADGDGVGVGVRRRRAGWVCRHRR